MNSVFVSIVIPTFNRQRILERCLDSLSRLEFACSEFEVIVVNDGGTAPSSDAVMNGVKLTIVTQQNRGPGAARNAGVARAKGKYIAFIDDDCTVSPDWLKNVATSVRKNPDALIGGRTVNILPRNMYSATSQSIIDYLYRYYDGRPDRPRFFASNNVTLSADLYRSIGGFDERFRAAEDREFCRRWNAAGRRMVYDDSIVVMHAHDLGLRSIHAQHFSYGRGAYPYRRTGATGGVRVEPLSFYTGLLAAPFRAHTPFAPAIAALTLTTQVANAAGFFFEMSKSLLLNRSRSLVDDSVLHDKADALGSVNVIERIARDRDDVGKLASLDRANSFLPAE